MKNDVVSKDKILAALPKLKQAELKEVQAVCEHLLSGSKDHDVASNELFDAIATSLQTHGYDVEVHNLSVLTSQASKTAWRKNSAVVLKFVDTHWPVLKQDKIRRIGFLRILILILLQYLERVRMPISLRTVILNLDKVPECYQRAFPGYLESGLSYLIPEAMKRGNE